MTRLIVHIGGAKCGSTAIQNFAWSNQTALRDHGIIVPNTDMAIGMDQPADQVWFFHSLFLEMDDTEPPLSVKDAAGRVASKIRQILVEDRKYHRGGTAPPPPPSAIFLSAENLSNKNGLHAVFELLAQDFEMEIILYIRRQEDMFMSGWQQWFMKITDDLDTWIAQNNPFFCDWKQTIMDWESVGADRLTVRLFDRASLEAGDVVADFCKVVGLDPADFEFPTIEVNVSHGVHIAQLIHDSRAMYANEHDTYFEHLLYRYKISAAAKRPDEILFTPDQLRTIRGRFSDDNAWIRARYFPDLGRADLFPELDYERLSCPDQAEINRRNREVLAQILQQVPIDPGTLPAIDDDAAPDVTRAQIAAATIELVSRLKRAGDRG